MEAHEKWIAAIGVAALMYWTRVDLLEVKNVAEQQAKQSVTAMIDAKALDTVMRAAISDVRKLYEPTASALDQEARTHCIQKYCSKPSYISGNREECIACCILPQKSDGNRQSRHCFIYND